MTVLAYTTNATFILRILKHYSTNPDRQWTNSYEFIANTPGGLVDLGVLINSWTLYEQALHNTFTVFDRAVISTWVADSVPYNPAEFLVQELTMSGTRDTTGELEPITTCLSIARQPTSGRLGHIFYRGVLSQGDTAAPAGITVLADPPTITTLLGDAITTGGVDAYYTAGDAALTLCMINKTGTQVRTVNALAVGGVSQLPVDHAWFNRT